MKECTEYKDIIIFLYKYIDKKNILFCKRVGKITQLPRKVLIKCSSFAIKENLFRLNALDENNVPFQVENYNLSFNEKCDKMHASYCKFFLNLDKFTSNFAATAELGSFPISLFIWTTCIKYWHRMEKGNCPNTLLNKTYSEDFNYSYTFRGSGHGRDVGGTWAVQGLSMCGLSVGQ